jgi:fatty-acyl-CoA synthase
MTVSREETQRKLDLRAVASNTVKPGDATTIADRLEEQAGKFPERPFLLYGEQVLTYAEVNACANQVAHAVLGLGLSLGDCVALAMENRPDFFINWFGLNKAGLVCGFINTHLTGQALANALEAMQAKAVIVGEEVLKNFDVPEVHARLSGLPLCLWEDTEYPAAANLRALCQINLNEWAVAKPRLNPHRQLREGWSGESTALLICTSGTTGLPKAACTSHMRWLNVGNVMVASMETRPQDIFYCLLPLYHGAAAMSLGSTALCAGSAIVIRRKFSVREFWPDVRRYGITVCQYVGEICRYLLNQPQSPDAPDEKHHTLRQMVGAGLGADIWQRFVERFGIQDVFEGWGATESNCNLINLDNRVGACGRVPYWEKTNLRLVRYDVESGTHPRTTDGFLIACQPGETGEVIGFIINHPDIAGGRFEGYTSAEATEQKIYRNVFQKGDAWWSSGDLFRFDEDGYFFFIDRIGDTFRWQSENVSTTEVAEALGACTGIESINIYGVKVPEHEGRAGMAAIVMQSGCRFDPRDFHALAEKNLPDYAVPLFVRIASAADMTSTFKLRKHGLQCAGYAPENFVDPLFVRDVQNATYVPWSLAALAQLGVKPFAPMP